jgi:hypothetical protein
MELTIDQALLKGVEGKAFDKLEPLFSDPSASSKNPPSIQLQPIIAHYRSIGRLSSPQGS